jgi:hypothetical protein
MDAISYLITLICYYILLVPTIIIFLPLGLIPPVFKSMGIELPDLIQFIISSPILLWQFVCLPWLAYKATNRRLKDNQPFWSSLGDAISEGKIYFALIPVIGRLFYKDSKEQ